MNTVIYYPFITPPASWLRIAALCWDTVYRIKPYGTPTSDSDEVAELDEACDGLLQSIDLRQMEFGIDQVSLAEARSDISRRFCNWVAANANVLKRQHSSSEEGLKLAACVGLLDGKFPDIEVLRTLERYGLAKSQAAAIEGTERDWLTWDLQATLKELSLMPSDPLWVDADKPIAEGPDYEKFVELRSKGYALEGTGELEEGKALIQSAVAIRERNRIKAPEYVREILVPADVASHYLSLVAAQFGSRLQSDLFGDNRAYAGTALHDAASVRSEVMTAVLQAHLPKDFNKLPVPKLVEIRRELSAKRLTYTRDVHAIVQEFGAVASEGQLNNLTRRMTEIALERVDEAKQTYRRAKLDMVIKTFAIQLAPPALAASVGSALGIGIFAPAGIAAAIALIAASKLLEYDKAKAEREKAAWSYVLDAAEALA